MFRRALVLCLAITNIIGDPFVLDNEEYEDAHLKTMELLEKYGYPAEEHEVKTSDGYILTIHRILSSCGDVKNPPILLQHGLISSSRDFIVIGPETGLGYMLSNECYDVWMPNFRGNTYSKKHETLSPESTAFWDFSWHDMGMHDVPACIDYILDQTKAEKLFYIGHSQGTSAYFVMDSLIPEYSEKVIAMFALAPISYLYHSNAKILVLLAQLTDAAALVTTTLGNGEFLPNNKFISAATGTACSDSFKPTQEALCENIIWALNGPDPEQLNSTQLPIFLGGYPAGSSTKQFLHYGQCFKNKYFRQYDYGLLNLEKYNNVQPPEYPLENAKSQYLIWHSNNDYFNDDRDVNKLVSRLPNILNVTRVPWAKFNHMDYLLAIDVKTLLYDDMLKYLKELS